LDPLMIYRDKSASGISFLDDPRQFDDILHGQWAMFDGFRDLHRASAADLTVAQRRALLLDLRETVVLEVAQAWYRVLRAERRAEVLQNSIAVQEQRRQQTAARVRIGTARTLDVAEVAAQKARTGLDLIAAHNDAFAGRQALALLTGVDVSRSPLHDDFVLPTERPPVDAWMQLAQQHRQDLQAAALAAEAASARVEVAFGQYYPSIAVSLDYFLRRDSLPTDRDWTSLLNFHLPLFTAGRIDADVREAWSQFRQEVLRYSHLRRQIQNDLAVASDQLASLDERLDELQQQTVANRETLRQADAGLRTGLATSLERVTAQDQLLRAEIDVAEGELERKTAWLGLLRLTGALTAGTVDVTVPPLPPPRPVPTSPFVRVPGDRLGKPTP
jgi:outer membrane protein